ncbi:MAG: hypothetical protein V3R83_06395 [Gammaproteobacteria bacterium]
MLKIQVVAHNLKEAVQGVGTYDISLVDGHWNANGHALVAQGMAEFVEHSGWAARR